MTASYLSQVWSGVFMHKAAQSREAVVCPEDAVHSLQACHNARDVILHTTSKSRLQMLGRWGDTLKPQTNAMPHDNDSQVFNRPRRQHSMRRVWGFRCSYAMDLCASKLSCDCATVSAGSTAVHGCIGWVTAMQYMSSGTAWVEDAPECCCCS